MNEWMEKIWSTDGILVDKNADGVIDGISLFVDPENEYFPPGLLDFFARVGHETTALSFNFFEGANQNMRLSWKKSDSAAVDVDGNNILITYRTEDELDHLLSELAEKGAVSRPDALIPEVKCLGDVWTFAGFGRSFEASPYLELSLGVHADKGLSMKTGMALCELIARASLLSTQFVLPWRDRRSAKVSLAIEETDQDAELQLAADNRLVLCGKREEIPGLIRAVSRARHWSEGGSFGLWTEELKRQEFQDDVMLEFEWEGRSEQEQIEEVLERYKGRIEEASIYISKDLAARESLKKQWASDYGLRSITVRSAFKTAFHWLEEELIPKFQAEPFEKVLISVREDDLPNGLELPIRWIQEIYPVDLLIEREWHMDRNRVVFDCTTDQEATYIVYGEKDGMRLEIGRLDVPVKRIDYVDGENYAYPSTVAVELLLTDGGRTTELFDSSRASFYSFYLQEVLPAVKREVQEYEPGQGHTIPFFDRIEIDVWMKESERKLGLDEERVSSLEALHEDLYFNTLDYFAKWGEEAEGKPFYAPGGVLPFMHLTEEDEPRAVVKVYRFENKSIPTVRTDRILFDPVLGLQSVHAVRDGIRMTIPVRDYKVHSAHVHPRVEAFLKKCPFKAVVPAESFRGIQIPVVECYLPTDEEFESSLKMTLQKPTVILEAGHHSNEVSSTFAVVELMESFTAEQLKAVNIVVIPLANVDGYQLLKRLMAEHPEWKHHAARFNAVGLEFSYVRFQDSVFGEGNVMPELLRKWAPDVIVDDHGIPSHEWVQPFAGYNSPPRFPVSYFLPSAKMYGIGRVPQSASYPVQTLNFKAITEVVSDEIGKTPVAELNKYWRERFKKYGNDWLPDIFLLEEAGHLNFYYEEIHTGPDSYFSIGRYPDWIAADIITEAADEIVYDDVLDSCVNAQKVFNAAIIEQVAQSGKRQAGTCRERPMQLIDSIGQGGMNR